MTVELVWWLLGAALLVYLLTGGADFGGGIWDLLARGPRAQSQRELIARAIAPIWEANHIWLIFVVVLLFTVFPDAWAAISVALHIPLTAALVGIVLRGAAFVFRGYGLQTPTWRSVWGRIFALASLLSPFSLGLAFAALATGDIRWQNGAVQSGFFAGWPTLFAVDVGLMTVALCALLAAVYLAVEADEPLAEDFRHRAFFAQLALGITGTLALWGAAGDAPAFLAAIAGPAGPIAVLAGTMLAGFATLFLLRQRRDRAARVTVAAQAVGVVLGWGFAMEGHLVRPDLTVHTAGAQAATLAPLGPALALGAAVLIPSLWCLYRVFKRR
ncbi:MAG: cytochrome d ubiquinol oxidase subunit II [Myxococcales bacterium]|nr:cytochrome d ubiquinol oxidase subunit II [Myxococcales bacterium]